MGSSDELSAFPESRLSSLVSALCLHRREQGRVCVSLQPEPGGRSAAQSPGYWPHQSPWRKRAAAMREACCALARACGSRPPRRPCHFPRSSCPGRDTCQAVWGVLGLHPGGGWGGRGGMSRGLSGHGVQHACWVGAHGCGAGAGFSRREGLTGPLTPRTREQQLSTEGGRRGRGGCGLAPHAAGPRGGASGPAALTSTHAPALVCESRRTRLDGGAAGGKLRRFPPGSRFPASPPPSPHP